MSRFHVDTVVRAGCGKMFKMNDLVTHWKFKHNWRLTADGSVDERSNSFWKTGGVIG